MLKIRGEDFSFVKHFGSEITKKTPFYEYDEQWRGTKTLRITKDGQLSEYHYPLSSDQTMLSGQYIYSTF